MLQVLWLAARMLYLENLSMILIIIMKNWAAHFTSLSYTFIKEIVKINYSNPTNTVFVALGAYNRILEKNLPNNESSHPLVGKWITLNET